jgi:hypothetical protein
MSCVTLLLLYDSIGLLVAETGLVASCWAARLNCLQVRAGTSLALRTSTTQLTGVKTLKMVRVMDPPMFCNVCCK